MTSRRAFLYNLIALAALPGALTRGRVPVDLSSVYSAPAWTVTYRGYTLKWTGWRRMLDQTRDVGQLLAAPPNLNDAYACITVPGPYEEDTTRVKTWVRAMRQQDGLRELVRLLDTRPL